LQIWLQSFEPFDRDGEVKRTQNFVRDVARGVQEKNEQYAVIWSTNMNLRNLPNGAMLKVHLGCERPMENLEGQAFSQGVELLVRADDVGAANDMLG